MFGIFFRYKVKFPNNSAKLTCIKLQPGLTPNDKLARESSSYHTVGPMHQLPVLDWTMDPNADSNLRSLALQPTTLLSVPRACKTKRKGKLEHLSFLAAV